MIFTSAIKLPVIAFVKLDANYFKFIRNEKIFEPTLYYFRLALLFYLFLGICFIRFLVNVSSHFCSDN